MLPGFVWEAKKTPPFCLATPCRLVLKGKLTHVMTRHCLALRTNQRRARWLEGSEKADGDLKFAVVWG